MERIISSQKITSPIKTGNQSHTMVVTSHSLITKLQEWLSTAIIKIQRISLLTKSAPSLSKTKFISTSRSPLTGKSKYLLTTTRLIWRCWCILPKKGLQLSTLSLWIKDATNALLNSWKTLRSALIVRWTKDRPSRKAKKRVIWSWWGSLCKVQFLKWLWGAKLSRIHRQLLGLGWI